MSEPVTLETLAKRLEAVEAQLAAGVKPAAPPWLAFVNSIDQSDEAVAFRRQIDEEMRQFRAAERAELDLDDQSPAQAHGDAA